MSVTKFCPRCYTTWTARTRREAATRVCPECRAMPVLAACVPPKNPKNEPADVTADSVAPAPEISGQPPARRAVAGPIVCVAAGLALFFFGALLLLGATLFLARGPLFARPSVAVNPSEPAVATVQPEPRRFVELIPEPKRLPELETPVGPTEGDLRASAAGERFTANYGTKIDFVNSPSEAYRLAIWDRKLVFVLHVSGNFEESKFT